MRLGKWIRHSEGGETRSVRRQLFTGTFRLRAKSIWNRSKERNETVKLIILMPHYYLGYLRLKEIHFLD